MRIGFFYESVENYHQGRSCGVGVVDEWGYWIGALPPAVAARVDEYLYDEMGDILGDDEIQELLASVALSIADICDECLGQHCTCGLEEQEEKRRRGYVEKGRSQ
jgi:hypothetical protein